jgi:uncharacterized protein YecA (UPF0149 family)/Flp pilus assembly protein TadD
MELNYYDLLDVKQESDKQALKKAYYKQVKIHSPETDPERFQLLREAYTFLSDDAQRAEYDKQFALPKEITETLLTANHLFKIDRYKEAIDYLTKAVKKFPSNLELNLLLGKAYVLNLNFNKAIKIFSTLAEQNPTNQRVAESAANAYYRRGFHTKAEDWYRKAIKIDPTDKVTWLSYLNFTRDIYDFALHGRLKEAEKIDPNMFANDGYVYGNLVASEVNTFFGVPDSDDMLGFLHKYLNWFLATGSLSDEHYRQAVSMTKLYLKMDDKGDRMPAIYEKLIASGSQAQRFGKDLAEIKMRMDLNTFKRESGYAKELIDLTILLQNSEDFFDDERMRFDIETKIVINAEQYRKDIQSMREQYPNYFELNKELYLDLLDVWKYEKLMNKFARKAKQLKKKQSNSSFKLPSIEEFVEEVVMRQNLLNDGFHDDDWGEDEESEEDFFLPFRREEPKVGRNDPCPCGSGKKYKHCCGK